MENKNLNEKPIDIHQMFSQEALNVLNFSPEDIEIIESAGQFSQIADFAPNPEKEMDEFYKEFDSIFANTDPQTFMEKFKNLPQANPKLCNQILAMSILFDEVQEVESAKTEKISLKDIEQEKKLEEDQKYGPEYRAELLEFLKNMPADLPNKKNNK